MEEEATWVRTTKPDEIVKARQEKENYRLSV